ncbi:MAG: signal peptide prediction [Ramlibacter sp.]|nr:signal peptide prediction [Ramlibacter sp.]
MTWEAVRLMRYLWAAPCTLVGLALTAPAFLFGAIARKVDGVIEIAAPAAMQGSRWLEALPFNAITFGHVVFATSVMELERLRTHEHAHVRQYEQWGIAFFLAYPASSVWQWLRGGRAYADNWFEVQARRCAGEGAPAA